MKDTIRGTKISFNPINILKLNAYLIQDIYPLLLSHHPYCKPFSRHTFNIGKLRFCIGCFILYPSAVMLIPVLYFIHLMHPLNWILLFIASAALYSTISLKFLELTHWKPIKIVVAFCLGAGIATSFWAFVLSPIPLWVAVILFIALNIGFALTGIGRMKSFFRVCEECKYNLAWKKCPGMKKTLKKLEDDGFDVADQVKYGYKNL